MASDWKTTTFEESSIEILDGDRGKNYPKKSEFTESGYCLFLNTGNVTKDGFKFSSTEFVSSERDQLLRKGKLQREDVVLTTRGTVGNVAYYDSSIPFDHIRINSGMVILRSDDTKILPRYLYLFLRSKLFEDQVIALQSGSAQPQLPIRDIKRVEIKVPSVTEQKTIAHILGSLDDKIELNRQMNETLEAMAQALFKSWFVDFDPVIDNALAAGNAIPDEFAERAEQRKTIERKDNADIQKLFPDEFEFTEEMGWIPKGWEVKESGDLFDVRDGTHDSPKKSDEGKYLITSRHITSGVIDYPNAYLISQDDFDEVNKRSLVESYDILITMIGTVGVSMLVLQDEIDFAIKNVGLFKTSNNKSYAVFFYLYLNSNYMTQFLDSRLAGTTQKYLTLKVLRALPVVTPDNKTLSHFVNNMSPIFKKIHSNHEQIGILAKLRDTLLPKLMSGEIRIPDAEALVEYV